MDKIVQKKDFPTHIQEETKVSPMKKIAVAFKVKSDGAISMAKEVSGALMTTTREFVFTVSHNDGNQGVKHVLL